MISPEEIKLTQNQAVPPSNTTGGAGCVLLAEDDPALKPAELRAMLMKTARDLGSPGRDDLFGAGEADAFAAVEAVIAETAAPVASTAAPQRENRPGNTREPREMPPIRALTPTMASEKPDNRPGQ